MRKSKMWALLASVMLVSLVLAACQPQPPATTVVTSVVRETGAPVVQTQIVEQEVVVTATPAPIPTEPKVMVVCMAQEPNSLRWTESDLVVSAVLEALYDGGIDERTYDYQAVYYTKLPNFDDGDAAMEEVEVTIGDTVYDVALDAPVTIEATSTVTLNQMEGEAIEVDFAVTPTVTTVQTWAQWTLVDGLTWEDGTPVTTDDQLFNLEVSSDPDFPSSKYLIERSVGWEAIDEKTLKWTGLPGYTDSTYFLNVWAPIPRHAYGDLSPAQMLEDETVNRDPLAFGPFKLDEWVIGDHITLSKNPTYWRASEGLPKLDQLIYRFIPDTNQLIAQLASGECDLGTQDAAFEGSLPLIRQFEAEGLMIPQVVAGTVYEHLDFNIDPIEGYTGFAGSVTNDDGTPIFANPEIRQAIALCLDKQAIVDQTTNGAAVVQHVYSPADHPMYAGDDAITIYGFDPAAGLALLEKNGWTDSNGDGVLDKGGQQFAFVHSTRTNALREKVTQVVQAQLKDNCMIQTEIQLYGGEFFDDGPEGIAFGRQFDLAEFAWLTGVEPPCDLYRGDFIPRPGNWGGANQNLIGYDNDEFDAACAAAGQAVDPEVKSQRHAEAQVIFSRDVPSIPLFARGKILVTRPTVEGVIMDPTANSEMWNVENFDLAPEQ